MPGMKVSELRSIIRTIVKEEGTHSHRVARGKTEVELDVPEAVRAAVARARATRRVSPDQERSEIDVVLASDVVDQLVVKLGRERGLTTGDNVDPEDLDAASDAVRGWLDGVEDSEVVVVDRADWPMDAEDVGERQLRRALRSGAGLIVVDDE